jgi:hypothetical protein
VFVERRQFVSGRLANTIGVAGLYGDSFVAEKDVTRKDSSRGSSETRLTGGNAMSSSRINTSRRARSDLFHPAGRRKLLGELSFIGGVMV